MKWEDRWELELDNPTGKGSGRPEKESNLLGAPPQEYVCPQTQLRAELQRGWDGDVCLMAASSLTGYSLSWSLVAVRHPCRQADARE
eukprot:CAMPEP_0206427520 /NCGR_PEP_ID=MMETSP0324_2-20121206/5087_1 /ASSEMBLY_ACC=CAM_ASM_000836 /TAXON_ID=2866 /ORGANISM="Crypthecodinium cohnii, Strain Seligo" /LENGTH=86 /DNA_ID=CAMNT_0053892811 /DNA_START=168 /DNA_END=428 /DNA_ORIENTATION=-